MTFSVHRVHQLALLCMVLGLASATLAQQPAAQGDAAAPRMVVLPRSTPADGSPQINGSRIVGATPGKVFLHRLAATGEAPLKFAVDNLPAGLTLDPATGIITGSLQSPGVTVATVHVSNSKGQATRSFIVVSGARKLALTPPLGWNSWNAWGLNVNEDRVKACADAFISTSLAAHGFQYVNIDDGWEIPTPGRGRRGGADPNAPTPAVRAADGTILTNSKFPDMKALAEYVHARGLKIGIYSSPGPSTCGGYTATYLHEEQDARTWAGWGIDYLKYDWCSYAQVAAQDTRNPDGTAGPPPAAAAAEPSRGRGRGRQTFDLPTLKRPYQIMRTMLDRTDRDIVYSLCQYGMGDVWEWGAQEGINGNVWRATGDINDSWQSMSRIGFAQNGHEMFTAPGHWNDTDMLVVGRVGWNAAQTHETRLTPDEQITHIGLWAILAAPMLLGCDLSQADEFTIALMSNDEVLAVNQDPLGRQGKRILPASPATQPNAAATAPQQVWARPLWDGTLAVGLFNLADEPAEVSASLSQLNESFKTSLAGDQPVRDLWNLKDLKPSSTYSAQVPRHGMVFLKIGTPKPETQCVAELVKMYTTATP